mmetsp:Transcript_34636/g.62816  ORF Transcript_34636/g.62816 Transcript_34636/m.62816 type:complete len:686 (+) Transcript_34636:101-2158(+)|eukprot:CAMPEP_0197636960 /NCGR_PEP_ID=MMETSP1338-20131121/12322_1 /TAXON_ID=43686 ORGANISM="Pelagodinium beii, Strain RCC1491" /NCGR_SAMPLE_ID=MMETSP1338 /ASSEMBLY_ACC=CAM_ASM_000754 /LENGTH=685 /DNA_ID=CAMNT_0043209297 /DNA_START=68 /DNA_END=2125 /DNA_ORIENTATION=-
MAAEEEAPDEGLFDPFSAAEAASEAIVEEVVAEGGKLLYDHYIARKSFAFAATSTCEALVAELMMCYVRHDGGESLYKPRQSAPRSPRAASPYRNREEHVRSHSSAEATAESPSPGQAEIGAEKRPGSAPAAAPVADVPDIADPAGLAEAGEGDLPPPPDAGEDTALAATFSTLKALAEETASRLSQEPRAGWDLEQEPGRCRIDTWARACVPIRKKLVRPKGQATMPINIIAAEDPRKGRAGRSSNRSASRASNGSAGSRSPSRLGAAAIPELAEARTNPGQPSKNQLIPLIDDREEDEEEAMLRELKDREARKIRDEQMKMDKKAAAEQEEAAKLAQVKDDKKNKQFTYDTEGNVIWVQQVAVHKLPSTTPGPNFTLKQDEHGMAETEEKSHTKPLKPLRSGAGKTKRHAEFKDGFKKFPSQQPSMMEAMLMSPGVALEERGRKKTGGDKALVDGATTMTRKDYEEMSRSGNAGIGYPGSDETKGAEQKGAAPPSRAASESQMNIAPTVAAPRPSDGTVPPIAEEQAAATPAAVQQPLSPRSAADPSMRIVRSELGAGLIPQPPATPRPVQPVPPPSARRAGRRDALGYQLSTRERMLTGGGSRFPNCAPPPPLGATMGHGLLPKDNKLEDFYFPDATSLDLGSLVDGLEQAAGSPPRTATAKKQAGEIVSKNPQLKSRLFGK